MAYKLLLCFFTQGKDELKTTSISGSCNDSSTVEDDSILHDGQSETGSAEFATSTFVDAIESFKDSSEMDLVDTYTVVGKRKDISFLTRFNELEKDTVAA